MRSLLLISIEHPDNSCQRAYCRHLFRWLMDSQPRTRLDALPHLRLTQEILRRFVSNDLALVSAREARLQKDLADTNNDLAETRRRLAHKESLLQQRDQELADAVRARKEAELTVANLRETEALCTKLEERIKEMKEEKEAMQANFNNRLEEVNVA